jgi:putative salt-induced outer membrane protein YdiY
MTPRVAKAGHRRHGHLERTAFFGNCSLLPALVADRYAGFAQHIVGDEGFGHEVAATCVVSKHPVIEFIVTGLEDHR